MNFNEPCEADHQYERESTFHSEDPCPRPVNILQTAIWPLHSQNPYGTALFCAVPPNRIFFAASAVNILAIPRSHLCGLCALCVILFFCLPHIAMSLSRHVAPSSNPHGTALFCTVPPNRIFSPPTSGSPIFPASAYSVYSVVASSFPDPDLNRQHASPQNVTFPFASTCNDQLRPPISLPNIPSLATASCKNKKIDSCPFVSIRVHSWFLFSRFCRLFLASRFAK